MIRKTTPHRLTLHSYLIFVLILLLTSFYSCNKEIEEPAKAKAQSGTDQPDKYFITTIVGNETDLGLIINDPISGMEYAASGPKNEEGKIDSILFIVETEPETGEWMTHEMNEDYTPSKTTTSTGQTIEYTELDPATKTGSVKVSETSTGKTIWESKNIKFDNNFFDDIEAAQVMGPTVSKRRGANGAEMLYLLTSAAGCGMGIIGLSMGPLALPWGVYNTYQNCKSAKDAAENLYNGKPAFGCITTTDNINAISGFAETISQGGGFGNLATGLLPALVNYGAQHAGAGQCDDEDNDDGNNNGNDDGQNGDNGDGSNGSFWDNPFGGPGKSWGDPHISTPDKLLYDFHGYGEFILTKSTEDNFEVQVRLGNPYSPTVQATLNTAIAIQTGSDVVCITANPRKLYINQVAHEFDFELMPLKGGAGIKREIDKTYQILTIRSIKGDLIKLRMDGGSYFDFDVIIRETRKGKVQGLLGNYDGDKGNDLQLRNEARVEKSFSAMYPAFADSWRVEAAKSLFVYTTGTSTETFTKKDFPKAPLHIPADKQKWAENICLQEGITEEPFLTNCTCDVALTEDPAMAKSAVWEAQKQIERSLPALDINGIQLQGEAKVIGNFIRLNEAKLFQAGQAFRTSALSGDFETDFTFRIPYSKFGSDDGFALLIAKEIPELKGNPYPGSSGKLGYEGVKASLAVEFDTWANAASDESGNHVAIHTNGKEANSTRYTTRLIYTNKIVPLADGMFHTVKVRYTTKRLVVFLDGAQVLEKEVDLVEKLGLERKFYIGFTASTSGGNAGSHHIGGWTVKSL